jgi:cytochrome c nitrite reductase small subunit
MFGHNNKGYMNKNKLLIYGSLATFVIALGLFVYLANAAKALSYLSDDSENCVNCHVMNTQYVTWQHSSHAQSAECVECHLPTDNIFSKYLAKAKNGWNHSVAFTLNTYDQSIKITENAAASVQANCISCHFQLTETMRGNACRYNDFNDDGLSTDRKCWDCHRDVPHGKTRSLITTSNSLGVR